MIEIENKKELLWIYHNFGEDSFTEQQGKDTMEEFEKLHLDLLTVEELKKKFNITVK